MIIENEEFVANIHRSLEELEKDFCILDKIVNSGITYWKIYDKNDHRILHINIETPFDFAKFYDFS